ncbi:MAG: hypothetical protein ACJAR5_001664, partial [Pseudophaeobacter arcticus]
MHLLQKIAVALMPVLAGPALVVSGIAVPGPVLA